MLLISNLDQSYTSEPVEDNFLGKKENKNNREKQIPRGRQAHNLELDFPLKANGERWNSRRLVRRELHSVKIERTKVTRLVSVSHGGARGLPKGKQLQTSIK